VWACAAAPLRRELNATAQEKVKIIVQNNVFCLS
jgi:hypothetical protein